MRNLIWGFILVILGIVLLLDNLGYANFEEIISDYWPLVLVLWGFSMLTKKRAPGSPAPSAASAPQTSSSEVTGDLLHQSNVFGDIMTRMTSQSFKGGSLSTVFGDCHLDLTSAQVAEGDHELRIHSVFGNSVLSLPKNAAVSVTGSSLFGNVSVLGQQRGGFSTDIRAETPSFSTTTSRLKVSISKVFGDVRVE